jgi:hypothetical protein
MKTMINAMASSQAIKGFALSSTPLYIKALADGYWPSGLSTPRDMCELPPRRTRRFARRFSTATAIAPMAKTAMIKYAMIRRPSTRRVWPAMRAGSSLIALCCRFSRLV